MGGFSYRTDGPFDKYLQFEGKLRKRLQREYDLNPDDENSGAPKNVREKYNAICKMAFKRYLKNPY